MKKNNYKELVKMIDSVVNADLLVSFSYHGTNVSMITHSGNIDVGHDGKYIEIHSDPEDITDFSITFDIEKEYAISVDKENKLFDILYIGVTGMLEEKVAHCEFKEH